MKISSDEISFGENMHVYKMKVNHDDVFDVQSVDWQKKDD